LRLSAERITYGYSLFVCWFSIFILLVIITGLTYKSYPILLDYPIGKLLFSSEWKPLKGEFGFAAFIISTIFVTGITCLIAVPLCLLVAIFLSEYCSRKLKNIILPFVDILAGVPSVIFGIWGVITVVPFIRDHLAPAFGYESGGYSILAGGIVLSLMVFPVMIYVMYDVIRMVPKDLRDITLSLGATKWETIKKVVLRQSMPGIIAAVVLGLSRAFGETIAVLMVVGNVVKIPDSIFSSGYPIPALIANNYGEMMSVPLYDSALMFSALLLLVVVLFFNLLAQRVLMGVEKRLTG
jgi:phosphate transport system permease protein